MWHGDPNGTNGSNITNGGYKASSRRTTSVSLLIIASLRISSFRLGIIRSLLCYTLLNACIFAHQDGDKKRFPCRAWSESRRVEGSWLVDIPPRGGAKASANGTNGQDGRGSDVRGGRA